MAKIKIIHKGLILVGVPVIFGTVFISSLYFGLSESNRMVKRELLLKDAMMSYIDFIGCSMASTGSAHCYKIWREPSYMERYKVFKRKAQDARDYLLRLRRRSPWLNSQIENIFNQNAVLSAPGRTDSPVVRKLQRLADQQSQKVLSSMNTLWTLLVGGMLTSTLISFALALYFCLNITNRLLIILNNTVCLSKGTAPSPPLKGDDEIAELDQFLFKSISEIRELERFKKEMIGVVSHELKSPLSSVGGFLSSLSAGVFGELSAKTKDKVDRTNNSVKRLMGLVRELLFLDRLELEMNPEEIAIGEIFTNAVDTVKELSLQSGIEIIVQQEDGRVYADRNRIVQVMVNLLSNAMKFSPQNGKVRLEGSLSDGFFVCRVSDEGRGIPEEFRKQIFEPFKQVDAKDATTKKGTGLGLTISRSIVEQHGGIIGVDSTEGKGSTFWFKIPASAAAAQKKVPDNTAAAKAVSEESKQGSSSSSSSRGSGLRKFGVLRQGLVIIAVPLIFQFAFVCVIGYLLTQIGDQIKREQDSKEIISSLNSGVDTLLSTSQSTAFYAMTNSPVFKKAHEASFNKCNQLINRGRELLVGDEEELKTLDEAQTALKNSWSMLDAEALKNEKAGFTKMFESTQKHELMGVLVGISAKTADPHTVDKIASTFSAESGMGTLELMNQLRTRYQELVRVSQPIVDVEITLQKLMLRERAKGEKLSETRSQMIKNLELTLAIGIVLNIGLSIFLAVTLMRSLTSRLQHVMTNTEHLVKREPLDAPIPGGDEIASLDQTLYETGLRLAELETFKRELISIVSHELRTPLLSISSALELLGAGALGDLSEKGKNRLHYAQEEANRLIRLINDLLDIEKMEAGKFVLDKSDFKVVELINTSLAAVAQLAEQRNIKLESSSVDATLYADRDRLCQVLINLLSNAIKFSPVAGLIRVNVSATSHSIEFHITDQGRGIPEELRLKIFDRFVQVEKADASERGGSGLGLAIARAIVEQHGGTIGVESLPGKGSTFYFEIPLTQTAAKTGQERS